MVYANTETSSKKSFSKNKICFEFLIQFSQTTNILKIKLNSIKKTDVNNPCTKTTCQNGGTCYADNFMNTQCFCDEGFAGVFCEIDKRPTTTTATTYTTEKTNGK